MFYFLQPQDRVEYEIQKAAAFAARASKRKLKDKPIRAFEDETSGLFSLLSSHNPSDGSFAPLAYQPST